MSIRPVRRPHSANLIPALVVIVGAVSLSAVAVQRRGNPLEAVERSTEIAWLEQLVMSDMAAKQLAEPFSWSPKNARRTAYARLGALGTPASLAAVGRIDRFHQQMPLLAESVSLEGRWPHPAPGMSDPFIRPAMATDRDGQTYAVTIDDFLGGRSVYLFRQLSDAPRKWTRPLLAGPAASTNSWFPPMLSAPAAGELLVSFAPPPNGSPSPERPPAPQRLVIADIARDRDGDGWTDLEEIRLGTDPTSADTDADGVPDGRDVTPTYAAPAGEAADEDAEVLRRALFGHFGLTRSPWALLVDASSRKLQLTGFAGPVVYDRAIPRFSETGGVYVSWRIVAKTADAASVSIRDWEGPLGGSANTVSLRRIDGAWYVVGIRMDSIS